ncbi:MAG TPA: RidA family protein [Acidimicrobiia bacterium]|nr:RidA family protein [Acidimicrobiia bacterium]
MGKRRVVRGDPERALGAPISWATCWGDLVFVSGVYGQDPRTGEWGDIRRQVEACLQLVEEILAEAGSSLDDVLTVTTNLRHREDFPAYNEAYRAFFPVDPPARTTILSDLVIPEMLVEISCVAGVSQPG